MVHVKYLTDPVCPHSGAPEPAWRPMQIRFADGVSISYISDRRARKIVESPDMLRRLNAPPGRPVVAISRAS